MNKVVSINEYRQSLKDGINDLDVYFNAAKHEITDYSWCLGVTETYIGMFYPGIVGVFLFKIIPQNKQVDEYIWVVVGDIPPLYITCENAPNAACALDGYIGAMMTWVDAAKSGKDLDGLPPVNVPSTPENAKKLQLKLDFLEKKILALYQGDLKE